MSSSTHHEEAIEPIDYGAEYKCYAHFEWALKKFNEDGGHMMELVEGTKLEHSYEFVRNRFKFKHAVFECRYGTHGNAKRRWEWSCPAMMRIKYVWDENAIFVYKFSPLHHGHSLPQEETKEFLLENAPGQVPQDKGPRPMDVIREKMRASGNGSVSFGETLSGTSESCQTSSSSRSEKTTDPRALLARLLPPVKPKNQDSRKRKPDDLVFGRFKRRGQ